MSRGVWFFVLMAGLLLGGCTPPWTYLEQPATAVVVPQSRLSVALPQGWVRATSVSDQIVITHDGPDLQMIRVLKSPHEKAFATLEKTTSAATLPAELAELIIATNKKRDGSVEVLENRPASFAGQNGCRLHLRSKTQDGLRYEEIYYAVTSSDGVFMLIYQAPALHYFQRDLPTFETLVASARMTP